MRSITSRFLSAALLSTPLMVPAVVVAQDHPRYHDNQRNEDHEWNNHEDKAYRIRAKQNHRKHADFAKLKAEDQQSYWGWP